VTPRRRPAFAPLAVLIAAALWGTTGTSASFLPASVTPLAVGAATMGIGGVLLFAVFFRSSVALLRHRFAVRWILVGALAVVVYPLAFYSGMALAGVAVGAVVSLGSAPLFAVLIERVSERSRLTLPWAVGTGAGILGVVLLGVGTVRSASEGPSRHVAAGILLALLAGFTYAVYTYTARRAIEHGGDSAGAMGATFGIGGMLLLPILVTTGAPLLQTPQTLAITAYLALGPMFVAYIFFGIGLRGVRASTATTLSLIEPLVATILAVAVVGERLLPLGWAGLALIAIGVAIAGIAGTRRDAAGR
jgi:DME family drug/metabolite transporter